MYDIIMKSRSLIKKNQVESLEKFSGVIDVVASFWVSAVGDVVVEVTCSFGWTSESS